MRLVARFTIPGKPVPKARARVNKDGHTWTPKRTAEAEANICSYAQVALRDWKATGPVEVHCRFFFPKNISGIPGGKVDLDNLLKLAGDALKPWLDDCLITKVVATKEFGEPRTIIGIWELAEKVGKDA